MNHPRLCAGVLMSLAASVLVAGGPVPSVAEAEQWVAVGYGGRRMVSEDGRNWTITAEWAENGKDDSNNLMGVAFGKGRYVVVGGGGFSAATQKGHILFSDDGRTWKTAKEFPNRVNPVVFGNGRFVAGGPGRILWWSEDGEQWHAGAEVPPADKVAWAFWFRHGAFGNDTFVMMGEGGAKKEHYWALATKDGTAVVCRHDLPQLRGLTFGNGRFVAVGPGVIATSVDGQEWTFDRETVSADEKLEWVLHTEKGFIIGGGKSTYASPDGVAWNSLSLKLQGKPVWTDGTRWISTLWPGKMSFSPDGRQWQAGPDLPPNGINRVAYRRDSE